MAQVITRCRLTGHYMFMGMDVDPKEFTRSPGPFARKFCPFCACDHLWHKEDSKFLAPKIVLRPHIQQHFLRFDTFGCFSLQQIGICILIYRHGLPLHNNV